MTSPDVSLEGVLALAQRRARQIVRDPQDAEDVAQRVAINYLEQIECGRRPDNVEAWVNTAVKNMDIDVHRARDRHDRRRRAAVNDGPDPVDALIAPQFASLRPAADAEQKSLLALIPDRDAQVIRLRYIEGLPSAAVAEELSISTSAVDQRAKRAVARLRKALALNPELAEELKRGHPHVY